VFSFLLGHSLQGQTKGQAFVLKGWTCSGCRRRHWTKGAGGPANTRIFDKSSWTKSQKNRPRGQKKV